MSSQQDGRVRRHHLCVMLSDAEASAIKALASASGLPKSEYVRQALFGGQPDPELSKRLAASAEELHIVLRELKRQGTNLNQIARSLNATPARRDALPSVTNALEAVRDATTSTQELLSKIRGNNG